MSDNKPVKKFKTALSWGIDLSAWANGKGVGYTLQKRYKDESGEWRESKTFWPSDLAALAELCRRAIEWNDTEGQAYKAGGSDADKLSDIAKAVVGFTADDDDIPFGN